MEFEILTANYNNARFLNDFFNSIINSSIKPNKIIFVDDCSTDNSIEIVNQFIEKGILQIQLIKNNENLGFANSLNIAMGNLTTKYFARLDPDDAVNSNRFELQVNYLMNNPSIDVIGTNVSYILNGELKKNSDVLLNEKDIVDKIKKGILPIIHGSIMGKTEAIKDFKYKQENVPAEDYDLFAFIVFKGFRITNTIEELTFVTVHENSVSNELKFSTIKKRFKLAEDYFGFKKSFLGSYFEYIHQLNYRKYLFENAYKRYFYLIISASVMPVKTFNKILKKIV
jgi:glycosyltransferase involved in cell wall biosynthesis